MEAAPVDGPQRPVSLWAPVIAGAITLLFLVQSALQAVPGMIKSISYEKRYLAAKSEFHSGNYQAALADFIGATELDKGCACLYRYIGLTQGQLGQADEERASYETALQREEFDWRTTALLSDRLRAAGNPRARNLILYTRPEYRAAQERWAWDSLSPPPVTMLDVGGDDIGYITDFQAIESDRNTTYRWTTDHSYARLAIPAGSGKLSVIIRLHSLGWPGPDDTVRIVVNGREAGEITAHPTWQEARLTLPDSVVSGSVGDRLVIELLTPARKPPGPETRHLGVAVDYIALERQQ